MFQILKMLFPKLFFGIDDLNGGGGAPDGQPDTASQGNGDQQTGDQHQTPTDVELEGGVKVSQSVLDKWAKETYKDRFEAFDNREKWQAENTRKAQEISEIRRRADAYDRLMADSQYKNQNQSRNPYEQMKQEYIQEMQQDFPDLDKRFLAKQFDWNMRLAGQTAQESISPLQQQQGEIFEANFLREHPDVTKGSPEYQKIANLMGRGVEAEEAYQIAMMPKIIERERSSAIKTRDEEAQRKLKQTRTQTSQGTQAKPKNFRENFDQTWEKLHA